MSRRVEIQLRSPMMIEWARQCIDSQQILWRGGYQQVMVSIYHNGSSGVAATIELVNP